MVNSIGALIVVRFTEVVRFWEGPLREVSLYMVYSYVCYQFLYYRLKTHVTVEGRNQILFTFVVKVYFCHD